jgi:hypothetical protein
MLHRQSLKHLGDLSITKAMHELSLGLRTESIERFWAKKNSLKKKLLLTLIPRPICNIQISICP